MKLNMELNMISLSPTKTIEQHHDDVFDELPKDNKLNTCMENIF
jgi:hypothetical protein